MTATVLKGIMIPFLGTSLGAACVFFMRNVMREAVECALTGFAAGVMIAASLWSLLLPSIDQAAAMGVCSFLPAAVGLWLGLLFFLLSDALMRRLDRKEGMESGEKCGRKNAALVLAVVLHNIPEGMAVGVIFAGWLADSAQISIAEAMALSLGIAIQNFPEGAIISMPLRAEGMRKRKAFVYGILSGIVEPAGAVLTILAAELVIPALPYLLGFAAGAMIYVVVKELIPEISGNGRPAYSELGIIFFQIGFTLMMILDVALG